METRKYLKTAEDVLALKDTKIYECVEKMRILEKQLEFSKHVLQKIEELSCEDVICDIADHALFKLNEEQNETKQTD